MTVKPGWNVKAVPVMYNEIVVTAELDTVDTDDPPNFPVHITTGDVRVMDTTGMRDAVDVTGAILKFVMEIELHEWREFLALQMPDGKYRALLHPHTQEGNDNYERIHGRAFAYSA